ncbi:unnamed protein product [Lactuca virosa]|uniref:Uncharacterized protein n=1 Tax=Lactuca virosa TaxID=75947 RepID=A0AAU9N2G9_9ASTR|nr:unnamed protein product [Lactuca virosa]
MPPRQEPPTDVTPPCIREQLSILIAISTANVRHLHAIITQMVTINTLISIQTETMANLIPIPPPNQQPRPPTMLSPPLLPPPNSMPSTRSPQQQLTSLQPLKSKTIIGKIQPVTFDIQPSDQRFSGFIPLQTNLLDLEDEVNFKGEGIDTYYGPYRRPPPWPDPLKMLYIKNGSPFVILLQHFPQCH